LEYVSDMTEGDPQSLRQRDEHLTPQEIAQVRERVPEALNAFFERYFDRAYGYVCRLVRDPDEAQDITQVAFMKIHRAVHTLDPDRDPTSWVFAVVSNTVRDYWRSKRYKQSRLDRPIEKAVISDNLTAEDDQNARDAARILARALDGLSEKLRAVVLLRDYEDLSYAEISEVLGIAEAAARKRHSRALNELRDAMEKASQLNEGKSRAT
jgi:RNA polymerase sigma-70 factor (ECF subfamily)